MPGNNNILNLPGFSVVKTAENVNHGNTALDPREVLA